jgi:hypothetical protein
VIALCRTHHRLYDSARLTLAPYLSVETFGRELAHAEAHVEAERLDAALGGEGWPAPWLLQTNPRRY